MDGTEKHRIFQGSALRDFILGWQDGLVNVLGLILGVAAATDSIKIIFISGLAATFAESISMAAVAYTSLKAERDFYQSELNREKKELEEVPDMERKEIYDIYKKKGFKGKILEKIVKHLTSNKTLWLKTMMKEELGLSPFGFENPVKSGAIVGVSAVIGSLIPLIPFIFMGAKQGIIFSVSLSALVLFAVGVIKAKLTIGGWIRSGIEVAVIGVIAAIAGYLIGSILGAANI